MAGEAPYHPPSPGLTLMLRMRSPTAHGLWTPRARKTVGSSGDQAVVSRGQSNGTDFVKSQSALRALRKGPMGHKGELAAASSS